MKMLDQRLSNNCVKLHIYWSAIIDWRLCHEKFSSKFKSLENLRHIFFYWCLSLQRIALFNLVELSGSSLLASAIHGYISILPIQTCPMNFDSQCSICCNRPHVYYALIYGNIMQKVTKTLRLWPQTVRDCELIFTEWVWVCWMLRG